MKHYFRITGGKLLALLEKYKEDFLKADSACREFAKSRGAVAFRGAGLLQFPEGKVPKGWIKSRKFEGFYFPGPSKAGLLERQAVNALLNTMGTFELYVRLRRGKFDPVDYSANPPSWFTRNGVHYLAADPKLLKAHGYPEGCQELLASEWDKLLQLNNDEA